MDITTIVTQTIRISDTDAFPRIVETVERTIADHAPVEKGMAHSSYATSMHVMDAIVTVVDVSKLPADGKFLILISRATVK